MSPSTGRIVPEHLLPYESELGANVTLENLIIYVFHMDNRPSVPKHWDLLPQVFVHGELPSYCVVTSSTQQKHSKAHLSTFHNDLNYSMI